MQCNYLFKYKIKQLRINRGIRTFIYLFFLVIWQPFIWFIVKSFTIICILLLLIKFIGLISAILINRLLILTIFDVFELVNYENKLLLNKLNTFFILVNVVTLGIHYLLQEKVDMIFLIFIKGNDLLVNLDIFILKRFSILRRRPTWSSRNILRPSFSYSLPLCWWFL